MSVGILSERSTSSVTPLIRWAGSKRHYLKAIAAYRPEGMDKYIEPFCGSAALYFHIRPKSAILSDTNKDLVNFYNVLKENPLEIHKVHSEIPQGRDFYYDIRQKFHRERENILRAAYFLYLNQNCFNGLYRTNLKGEFNVPFSGYKTRKIYDLNQMIDYSNILRSATVLNCDFENIIRQHGCSSTFLFVDPPYACREGRVFTEYGATPFSLSDLDRLIKTLLDFAECGGKFVLTYDASLPSIVEIPTGWSIESFKVRRNVGGFAASRKMAEEVIVSNIS